MTREETIEYNRLVEIINDTQEMFVWLDEYRKRKDKNDKRALYAAHDYETQIRKKIANEVAKHYPPQNKAA